MNKNYLSNLFIFSFCIFLTSCFPVRLIRIISQRGESQLVQKQFLEEIPFTYSGNYIALKGRFTKQASEKRYFLDTGAPTVISEASFKANRFPTLYLTSDSIESRVIDSLGQQNVLAKYPKLPEMHLGKLEFKDVAAYVMDGRAVEKYACYASDGIIGANMMNDAIWQIDYSRQVLTVSDDLKKLKNIEGAAQVKFKNSGPDKKPIIPVTLNGKKYWFLFDTGSSLGITFSPELLPFYGANTPDRVADFSMYGLRTFYTKYNDTLLTGKYVNLPEFGMGTLNLKNVNATALELPFFEKEPFLDKQSGNIGNKFFQNFIVTINWKNNTIYFAPQPNPVKPSDTSHFGLLGKFDADKKYVVQILFKGSEAEKAGIKMNDEIISVNGNSMKSIASERYCEIMNNPEKLIPEKLKEATFSIRHANGEIKTYTLQRQSLFPEQISTTSRQ